MKGTGGKQMVKKVDNYLNGVKIKRAHFGGFDETDVYKVLDKVCNIYEAEMEQNQSKNAAQILQSENNYKKKIRELSEETKYLEKENETYRRENERLTALVSQCMTIKEELGIQAEKEAEKIKNQAVNEAAEILRQAELEAEQIYKDARKTKEELMIQITELKKAKNNIVQSFNVIQRFCGRTQKEILVLKERDRDTDKNKEAVGRAEGLKESTEIFGEHLKSKIEGPLKDGQTTKVL